MIFDGYHDNAYHFSNDEGVFALSPDRSGNRLRLIYNFRLMDPQMLLLFSLLGGKDFEAEIKKSNIYKYKIEDDIVRVDKGKNKEYFRIRPNGNMVLL